jgi:hypothetical protein
VPKSKTPQIIPGRDMTISEWCFKRHITRVHFYRMKPEDRPDIVGSGKSQRITPAADERWETQQTANAKTQEAKDEAERRSQEAKARAKRKAA